MLIDVTQDDIHKSESLRRAHEGCWMSRCCPVALAAKRAFGFDVTASQGGITECLSGKLHELPKVAVDFITAFDRECPVAPFTFELE